MLQKESALRVGFTFAGCYLGAGYVSGQELWQFFGCFGRRGIGGLVLAVSLSFFFGVLLLRLVQRTGLHQTDTLVVRRPIPLLRGAVGVLQLVILFGIFVIMAAGVGALLRQLFGLSSAMGSALFCVAVTLLSFRGTSGMVRVFSAVVPMLVICSVTVSVLTLRQAGWHFHIAAAPPDGAFAGNWAAAACIFVSYNLFSSIGILAPVGAGLRSRRTVWAGVLCGCVMLFSIALGILLALQTSPAAVAAPLPMLYAAGELGPVWYGAYALLLFGAMWGTALSCCVAILHFCSARAPRTVRPGRFAAVFATLSWLCSLFGFGRLIGTVYPVFGVLGALALLGLLHHRISLHSAG